MKLNIGKRIVMFIHAILTILLCAALIIKVVAPAFASRLLSGFKGNMGALGFKILCVALLAVYAALAVAVLLMALNRGKKRTERGFISVDSTDSGHVRIAVSAIEQMVRQSVRGIDGINDMKISIEGQDDAIAIAVNAIVASGSHVPTLTRNMQRSIRQFVEVNCGVSVNAVSISIDAVSNQSEGKRQRIWGRGRADKTAAPAPTLPEAPASPVSAEEPAEASSVSEAADAPATEDGDEPMPYDFDKPYESEFAKNLAALREREAAEAGEESGNANE